MKRKVFAVEISNRFEGRHFRWEYEVIAQTPHEALDKAIRRVKKDEPRAGGWQIESLRHRGDAV